MIEREGYLYLPNIDYLKPVYVGMEVKVVGRVLETREREALLRAEIFAGNGEICTRAEAAFGLFSMEAMNRRGVLTPGFMDLFARLGSPR